MNEGYYRLANARIQFIIPISYHVFSVWHIAFLLRPFPIQTSRCLLHYTLYIFLHLSFCLSVSALPLILEKCSISRPKNAEDDDEFDGRKKSGKGKRKGREREKGAAARSRSCRTGGK